MRRAIAILLLPCCIALLLTGCAGLIQAERPELSLVNVQVSDMTLFETSMTLTLRISNEDIDPMRLEGGVIKLGLQGVNVGKGFIQQPLEVEGLSSTTVEVPVFISNLTVATRLRPILESGILAYSLRGKLFQETQFGTRRVQALGEGVFDFNAPPAKPAGAP